MGRITLNGFLKYDPTLFDGAPVPESMDKATLIRYILKWSGDMFPWHQSLPDLKQNITDWFTVNEFNFGKIWEAYHTEFEILDNMDRKETWTDSEKTGGSDSVQGSSTATGTDGTQSTVLNDNSAYNESDYGANLRQESDGSSSYDRSDSATSTTTYGRTGETTHTAHIHGNIGLTRNDEMITYSARMYADADVYKKIARLFEEEFLIQIY